DRADGENGDNDEGGRRGRGGFRSRGRGRFRGRGRGRGGQRRRASEGDHQDATTEDQLNGENIPRKNFGRGRGRGALNLAPITELMTSASSFARKCPVLQFSLGSILFLIYASNWRLVYAYFVSIISVPDHGQPHFMDGLICVLLV
ncbi:unnamed protein product, partial [Onchocerca flexuosa]|uniref:DUF1736 domain-containing protein n=1 Tax=Onchocerca flexuosa TaxID=387005 RepID=A0A183I6E8_9BILA